MGDDWMATGEEWAGDDRHHVVVNDPPPEPLTRHAAEEKLFSLRRHFPHHEWKIEPLGSHFQVVGRPKSSPSA